jgi:hypothetical protein
VRVPAVASTTCRSARATAEYTNFFLFGYFARNHPLRDAWLAKFNEHYADDPFPVRRLDPGHRSGWPSNREDNEHVQRQRSLF